MKKWLYKNWYKYLFEKPWNLKKLICRYRGHPCGPIWYSTGMEPDYTCKNCGDHL